jgi:defect in organelle trafficking protein DotD
MWSTRSKVLSVLLCLLVLPGCSKKANEEKASQIQVKDNNGIVIASLDDAARSVALSLNDLSVIAKAENPPVKGMPFKNLNAPELDQELSLQWYGPVAPALEKIAKAVNYQVQVFGKPPKTPILVNIGSFHDKSKIIDLIRDIDIQSGLNASVLIFPDQKIISLRYTSS